MDDKIIQQNYISNYCKNSSGNWSNCKRLITKNEIHFCPDFVLPDTVESVSEIIDIYDNSIDNN
ncbi:MAG: hypothetical protein KBB11_09700 [Bacteroidales bacterium]|nr:hypothetical protein [Bacteroidales bacterium]HOY39694.1 hypothetical protein [Bacteroidales bacterium]HQP04600.1 hypothetical protein [Bacteroidales bacterium]